MPLEIGGKKIGWPWVAGGVAGVGMVVWIYRKNASNSQASAANATGANTTGIDPLTQLPYSQDNQTDPVTGMTYLTEAQQYGSVAAAEAAVSGGAAGGGATFSPGFGVTGPVDSGFGGSFFNPSPTPQPAATGYASFAQWAQAVQAGLTGLGYSQESVAAALGLFNAQHPLTADQAQIIRTAEAEFGPPPGGPYQIIPTPSHGGPTKRPVPDVKGLKFEQAHQVLDSAGFKAVKAHPTYEDPVTEQHPKAGTEEPAGTTVRLTGTPTHHKPKPEQGK